MGFRVFAVLAGAILLASCASVSADAPWTGARAPAGDPPDVVIFSLSTGYQHASVPAGVAALTQLAQGAGYRVSATDDPALFSNARLADVEAIILLSNTTDRSNPATEWFDAERRAAFEAFVHRGGGIVAIHAATGGHPNWGWYRRMLGGFFEMHPPGEPRGEVTIVDHDHPATRALPHTFTREDEWYYFIDFDPTVRVLATYDPASIGQDDSNPNPLSWAHDFEGGRVFYTAMGHKPEHYQEQIFLDHIAGGLRWALRLED